MVLVWQASDGYPWAVCFWTCSFVWFRSLKSNEGGQREVKGEWMSPWDSRLPRAPWFGPEDSASKEDGWGELKLTCMVQGVL